MLGSILVGATGTAAKGLDLRERVRGDWNQQMGNLTFSNSSYATASFTMPEIQIPNCSGNSTTWLSITSATVIGTQCGSTPGTDLVCNLQ